MVAAASENSTSPIGCRRPVWEGGVAAERRAHHLSGPWPAGHVARGERVALLILLLGPEVDVQPSEGIAKVIRIAEVSIVGLAAQPLPCRQTPTDKRQMSPEGLVEESHRYQIMTGLACGAVPKRLMLESSPVARPPVCFPASRGSGNRNLALIGIPRAQGHLMLPSSRSSHLCATGASAGEKPLIGDELDAAGARRGPLCAHPPPRARMLHLIGGRGLGDRQGPCPFLKSQLSPLLWVRVNNVVSPIW